MSAAVPPMPSDASSQALSEPMRISNAFFAPSKTFEDIRRNASWWAPWLIGAILSLGVGAVLNKKVNWEEVVRQQVENGPRAAAFANLSPQQQQQQLAIGAKVASILVYAGPIILLIIGLVVAAIFMVTFNFGFEAEVSFSKSLAIVFYSFLPQALGAVITIITLLLRTDMEGLNPNNPVGTNLAYYLDKATIPKFLYGMAGALDVISIWSIILIGMGFAMNAKPKKLSQGAAVVTVAVIFLIYKAASASIGFGG